MSKLLVTINTDAGYLPDYKVGAYAFWIKSSEVFLSGSGLFKKSVQGSTHAEIMSIINALIVLDRKANHPIRKIIINRDNINAIPKKNGRHLERYLYNVIEKLRVKHDGDKNFCEFRHVKAHTHTNTRRHWVNDWCDRACRTELNKFKQLWKSKEGCSTTPEEFTQQLIQGSRVQLSS